MPATYDRDGLRFQYPENWTITDEQWDEWPRAVTVQTPGGGLWIIHVYPPESDPQQLTDEVLAAMRQEYTDVESEVVVDDLGGTQAVGYNMEFYCLDFVVAARTLGFTAANQTYLLVFQAETREFEELSPVFQAMAVSLSRSLT